MKGCPVKVRNVISKSETRKEQQVYIVVVSFLGDKWQWKVDGILALFRLLDKLQKAFAASEITVTR
jgi:hypothetical protein